MLRLKWIWPRKSVASRFRLTVPMCLGPKMDSLDSNKYTDPKLGRVYYRKDNDFKMGTFGKFPGFLQANLALVHEAVAGPFLQFCRLNSSALPLLFYSEKGQVNAPDLADDSDIRTDVSTYLKYENGSVVETLPNLVSYPWESMVSFYLGCSFSFDDRLKELNVPLRGKNVSMFETSIPCISAPPFECNMVVSMRPVDRGCLKDIVNVTRNLEFAHGAPIHIGRPADIGINDVTKARIGDPCDVLENEVPVFWACGVTAKMAITGAKLPLAFTHYPGCMFVSDVPTNSASVLLCSRSYPEADVITLSSSLQRFSIVSRGMLTNLQRLDKHLKEDDPGNRGIKALHVEDDFIKACLDLSANGKSVAIFFGFPLHECANPYENDGVSGAVYIARALQRLGIKITFVIDGGFQPLIDQLIDHLVMQGVFKQKPHVLSVGKGSLECDISFLVDSDTGRPKYSHLIAIERPSRAADGNYYTMKGRDISKLCEPMDVLFMQARKIPDITTIGIGDGGNELGMGKVRPQVERHVPLGHIVAATASADYLIACGVSDWGGLAVAAGLYMVRKCAVHERFQRRGLGFQDTDLSLGDFVPSDDMDEKLHEILKKMGFRDGITGKADMSVDGLDYYEIHIEKLRSVRRLATV